jgi:hypothetical protein
MASKRELCRSEDVGWVEFHGIFDAIPPRFLEETGYSDEWSAKDLLAHVGCWQAEAVCVFQRMRAGTFVSERLDVDAMNAEFVDANRPLPPSAVRAEAWAARTRMLQEFDALPEITPEAQEWFVECGATHYREHVERLRQWVQELQSRV